MARRDPQIRSLIGLPDDQQLTITDVAGILNEHYSTTYERVVSGEIGEYHRRGKVIRVEAHVLRAYIEKCKRPYPQRDPHSFIDVKKKRAS